MSFSLHHSYVFSFFFFNDTATTEIYTSFPTRRSSDLAAHVVGSFGFEQLGVGEDDPELVVETVEEQPELWRFVHRSPDRKSTRLNSSHSQISYAVFCLKKKKNKKLKKTKSQSYNKHNQ